MLTTKGKIIFTVVTLAVLFLIGALFFKGNPLPIVLPPNEETGTTATSAFTPDPDTLAKLESAFSSYDIDTEKIASGIYWSADGKYVLFEGVPKQVKGQQETGARIIFGDLVHGTYEKIYDGSFAGEPSWTDDYVVFPSDGLYLYHISTKELIAIAPGKARSPQISPDGKVVAYEASEGIQLYSVVGKDTTSLTANPGDTPARWYSDSSRLIYFKSDGTDLGEGAGMRKNVAVFDRVSGESHDFEKIPKGTFRRAEWIDANHLHVMGGFDDGRSDYILTPSSGAVVILGQNILVSETMIDVHGGNLYSFNLGTLAVYASDGNRIQSIELKDSWVVPATVPYAMKVTDNYVILTYVGKDGVATLKFWDIKTGTFVKETPAGKGTAIFFAPIDAYVVPTKDSTALDFNTIE